MASARRLAADWRVERSTVDDAEAGQIQPPLPDAGRFVDLSYPARAGMR